MFGNLCIGISSVLLIEAMICPSALGMEMPEKYRDAGEQNMKRKSMASSKDLNPAPNKKRTINISNKAKSGRNEQHELVSPAQGKASTFGVDERAFLNLTPKERKELDTHFHRYLALSNGNKITSRDLFDKFVSLYIHNLKGSFEKYQIERMPNKNEIFIALVNHYFSPNEKKLIKISHSNLAESELSGISSDIVLNLSEYLSEFPSEENPLFKAAQRGHPVAQYWYAMLNENIEFLEKSAAQEYAEALYGLSKFYLYPPYWKQPENMKNQVLAYILCKEAARKGHEEAEFSFASSFLEGTYGAERKDEKKGMELLNFFAKKGNKIAEKAIIARNRIEALDS